MNNRLRGYRWLGYVVIVLTLIVIALPVLLVRGCSWESGEQHMKQEVGGLQVKLMLTTEQVINIPLEQYLCGVDLRKELGLRSTAFKVTSTGEEVVFSTQGYGHAVGMCQYGADGLADSGAKYDQILAHYYKGAKLRKYTLKERDE